MQIDYGQGITQAPPSDLLVQLSHRAAVVATLVTLAVIGLAIAGQEPRPLIVSAVIAADVTVILASIGLVAAYRSGRSLKEVLGIFFVALVLAQLSVWSLIKPLGVVASVRELSAWIVSK